MKRVADGPGEHVEKTHTVEAYPLVRGVRPAVWGFCGTGLLGTESPLWAPAVTRVLADALRDAEVAALPGQGTRGA